MTNFSKCVKMLMIEKNLSQKELSLLSGVSEASLCRYVRGEIEPRIDVVQNVARALGVPETYLLGISNEYKLEDAKKEIMKIIARNRNVLSKEDKSDIISILYGGDYEC